jgi:hypothetical protein
LVLLVIFIYDARTHIHRRNLSYGFVSEIRDSNPGTPSYQVKLSVTTPSIVLVMSAVLSGLLHKRYTHAYFLDSLNCPRRSTRASVVRWNSEAGSTVVHSAGVIWRLPARRNSACNKEAVLLLWNYHYEKVKVFIDHPVGIADMPYILQSNPHTFYSFRGLKNQMRIRIACGLDSQ